MKADGSERLAISPATRSHSPIQGSRQRIDRGEGAPARHQAVERGRVGIQGGLHI